MRITNDRLLQEFRAPGHCEWCWEPCPEGRHPHHILARGMGGGGQLDVAFNLIGLCWLCHRRYHDGNMPPEARERMLGIAAKRELDLLLRTLNGTPIVWRYGAMETDEQCRHALRHS